MASMRSIDNCTKVTTGIHLKSGETSGPRGFFSQSGRRQIEPDFDPGQFIKMYVTLAAQRASKILGIFARLDMRDGKPQYLRHIPRIWGYLQRSLTHPSLASLQAWYRQNVPAPRP